MYGDNQRRCPAPQYPHLSESFCSCGPPVLWNDAEVQIQTDAEVQSADSLPVALQVLAGPEARCRVCGRRPAQVPVQRLRVLGQKVSC